jgi:hypothetical protein
VRPGPPLLTRGLDLRPPTEHRLTARNGPGPHRMRLPPDAKRPRCVRGHQRCGDDHGAIRWKRGLHGGSSEHRRWRDVTVAGACSAAQAQAAVGKRSGPRPGAHSPELHAARGRVRPDLQARAAQRQHDHRQQPGAGGRALRRDALREGAAPAAAGNAGPGRGRAVHGRDRGGELGRRPPDPHAGVRAGRPAVHVPRHGRHRRTADVEVGTPGPRRTHRPGRQRDPAHASTWPTTRPGSRWTPSPCARSVTDSTACTATR